MTQTLDQQRAQFAWAAVNKAHASIANFKDYKNLAKGAPAHVMGNGLMATIAFYKSRGKDHATQLMNDILGALAQRDGQKGIPPFAAAMTSFQTMNSLDYMHATDETLAMLKWLRQFADAVSDSTAPSQDD
jgi:CRISPR-associated protein Cmr5